jgi:hypothetical protein
MGFPPPEPSDTSRCVTYLFTACYSSIIMNLTISHNTYLRAVFLNFSGATDPRLNIVGAAEPLPKLSRTFNTTD